MGIERLECQVGEVVGGTKLVAYGKGLGAACIGSQWC